MPSSTAAQATSSYQPLVPLDQGFILQASSSNSQLNDLFGYLDRDASFYGKDVLSLGNASLTSQSLVSLGASRLTSLDGTNAGVKTAKLDKYVLTP